MILHTYKYLVAEKHVLKFQEVTANQSQLQQQLQILRDIRSSYLPSSTAASSSLSSSFDFKSWSQKNDTSYLFLHVGKAAGSTVYCKLTLPRIDEETRFKQKSWCKGGIVKKKERAEEIPLYSQKFDSRLHMSKVEEKDGSHEVFLVNLRNPITRFLSAYEYEKSKQNRWIQRSYPIFKRCFPNEVSAQSLLLNLEGEGGMMTMIVDESSNSSSIMSQHTQNTIMNTSSYCREVAMNVAKGLVTYYRSHMTYNYQFYENQFLAAPASADATVITNANINNSTSSINNNTNGNKNNLKHLVAVRSEYLEQDFKYFEMLLRNGVVVVDEEDNNNTTTISDTTIDMNVNKNKNRSSWSSIISPNAVIVLCRVLCEDIQAYKRFLFRAENLNEEMVLDSIRDLQKHCPMETLQVREEEQCKVL